MSDIFRELKIYGQISGTKPRPREYAPRAAATTPTDAQIQARLDEIEKWEDDDAKARNRLRAGLDDVQMQYVANADTALDMWNSLCNIYEQHGIITVRKRLYQMASEEEPDLPELVGKLRAIQNELASMGDTFSDKEFCFFLMGILPKSWDPITKTFIVGQG